MQNNNNFECTHLGSTALLQSIDNSVLHNMTMSMTAPFKFKINFKSIIQNLYWLYSYFTVTWLSSFGWWPMSRVNKLLLSKSNANAVWYYLQLFISLPFVFNHFQRVPKTTYIFPIGLADWLAGVFIGSLSCCVTKYSHTIMCKDEFIHFSFRLNSLFLSKCHTKKVSQFTFYCRILAKMLTTYTTIHHVYNTIIKINNETNKQTKKMKNAK